MLSHTNLDMVKRYLAIAEAWTRRPLTFVIHLLTDGDYKLQFLRFNEDYCLAECYSTINLVLQTVYVKSISLMGRERSEELVETIEVGIRSINWMQW